jgi:hypothetical protein
MQQSHASHPVSDRVRKALEESCGTLLLLESIRASYADPAGANRNLHKELTEAIESLRQVIGELRAVTTTPGSEMLALGFVLDQEESEAMTHARECQAKPRRTA